MKLYSNGLGSWVGTQVEAKKFAETYCDFETYVVYKYMMHIDDELELKKELKV